MVGFLMFLLLFYRYNNLWNILFHLVLIYAKIPTKGIKMAKKEIQIRENQEFITLNVLLKIADLIPTGGAAKFFLQENVVLVNGEKENRRGRKLYRGDVIEVQNQAFIIK